MCRERRVKFYADTIAKAKDQMAKAKVSARILPTDAEWSWQAEGPVVNLQLSMEGQITLTQARWNSVTGEGWYAGG